MAISLNKFFLQLGKNIGSIGKHNAKDSQLKNAPKASTSPVTEVSERPESPFVILLPEGNENEFNYTPMNQLNAKSAFSNEINDVGDDGSVNSSLFMGSNGDISSTSDGVDCELSGTLSNSRNGEDTSVKRFPGKSNEVRMEFFDLGTSDDVRDREIIFQEDDERRSFRVKPMTKEKFEELFDPSGRLINEHELRKSVFKGGVEEGIRKDVWKFLFELYPFNTTVREREILMIEQTLRYEALKIRWKILLKTLENDYEGVRYCPKWYSGCPVNAKEHTESLPKFHAKLSVNTYEQSSIFIDGVQASDVEQTLTIPTCCKVDRPGAELDLNSTDLERNPIGLTCLENSEEKYNWSHRTSNSTAPSSYDINLSQIHLLSQSPGGELESQDLSTKIDCEDVDSVTISNRATSVDFECNEVDSLSEALADAMKDIPTRFELDTFSGKMEDFDILAHHNLKDGQFPDLESTDEEMHFPNPFTLPAEYINNQESLYSKSDNFKSFDLFNEDAEDELLANNENDFNTNTEDEIGKHTAVGNAIDCCEMTKEKEADHHDVFADCIRSITYDELNYNYSTSRIQILKPIDSGLPLDDNHNKPLTENDSFALEPGSEVSAPLKVTFVRQASVGQPFSLNNMKKQKSLSCPDEINLSKSFNDGYCASHTQNLSVCERRESLARSPTGEKLENVPPWIAQMIKASSPGSPVNERRHSAFSDYSPKRQRKEIYNFELLNIVENANRYVKEHVKQQVVRTTPNLDFGAPQNLKVTAKESKILSKSALSSPLSTPGSSAKSIFMNITPQFQCVESMDSVDNRERNFTSLPECPYCSFDESASINISLPVSSIGEEHLKFMEIQAQVYAARQVFNESSVTASVRVIDKDVPRTDRELQQFSGDDNPGLIKLRDTLLTYAFFHPEVGYAQGMNDIMSRFLVVMDTESEAYWMFCNYMEHFKNDFMEEGMLRKVALVEQLLMKMDRELYDSLQSMDMGLMFCHRWLLLNFKREFEYMEAVRLFEITSSRHLEVSSVEAELERSKERAKEFLKDSSGSHLEEIYMSPEYPYDIFVCVTMLMECRLLILDTRDFTTVYQILSNLPTTLDLQEILRKSEELFYRYCRRTVVDCFQVIDELEVPDFKRKNPFQFSFR